MHTCSLLKVMNSTKFHKDIEVLAQSEHRIRSVRPDRPTDQLLSVSAHIS